MTNACGDLMETLGYELETKNEPIFGSFLQKFDFLKKHATSEKVDEAIDKAKKALELKHVDLPTAEQTEKLANSAKTIVTLMDGFNEAIVKLGAIIVIKRQIQGVPRLVVFQLPFHLIQLFDEKPQLLLNIETVWEILSGDEKNSKYLDDSFSEVAK